MVALNPSTLNATAHDSPGAAHGKRKLLPLQEMLTQDPGQSPSACHEHRGCCRWGGAGRRPHSPLALLFLSHHAGHRYPSAKPLKCGPCASPSLPAPSTPRSE